MVYEQPVTMFKVCAGASTPTPTPPKTALHAADQTTRAVDVRAGVVIHLSMF
jgi:hypothetical protein